MSLEEEEMEVEGEEAMEAPDVGEQAIEAAATEDNFATSGNYTSKTVNEKTFEELHLGNDLALEVQVSWKAFPHSSMRLPACRVSSKRLAQLWRCVL
jgi:hypothetical protein